MYDIQVTRLSCGKASFAPWESRGTYLKPELVELPIQKIESRAYHRLIDQWRAHPKGITCEQEFETFLKEEKEKQARLDEIDTQIEAAHSQGDVMLVTNQKLLECKLEPQCEAQVLDEVDICKKTSEGRYVESCIRAIEPPR